MGQIQQIDQQNRKLLLKLARKTIELGNKSGVISSEEINSLPALLKEKRGCFVTLTKNKNLRGCIGYILPEIPLYQAVIDNAYHAAYTDPRFNPVSKSEIKNLHLEISVLTVPQKLSYKDSDDFLNKLRPLQDGLIIKKGYHSATFLPQVWEQLPEKKEFLSHLCQKAGLSSNEWSHNTLEVETYQAEVFEEE